MKFGKAGQVGLVSATALGIASLFTACGTLNVGFLFVATNKQTPGQIEVYEVNSETGGLKVIPTSPFPSGGRDPIAEVVSPVSTNKIANLYVANQDDNNIVQFTVGTDGKLYPQSTINTPGTFPMALGITPAGTYVYVVDILGPTAGCSLENSCPGVIAGYAVTSASNSTAPGAFGTGSLGQICATASGSSATTCTLGNPIANSNGLGYLPLLASPTDTKTVLTPTSLHVLGNGNFLYVTAYNPATSTGYLFGFAIGSGGALTPTNGGAPLSLGAEPVAMASDSGSATLYVVDEVKNQVDSFSVGSDGTLSLLGTTATGDQPSSLTLINDKFLYVANSLDATVTAYAASSGSLSRIGNYASDTNPIAILGDPRGLGYLYTVNFLNSTLSGYKIDPSSGALINADRSPYLSNSQPTAISGIPHGGSTH